MATVYNEKAVEALKQVGEECLTKMAKPSDVLTFMTDIGREHGGGIHLYSVMLRAVYDALPVPYSLMPFNSARDFHPTNWRDLGGYAAVQAYLTTPATTVEMAYDLVQHAVANAERVLADA